MSCPLYCKCSYGQNCTNEFTKINTNEQYDNSDDDIDSVSTFCDETYEDGCGEEDVTDIEDVDSCIIDHANNMNNYMDEDTDEY